METLEKGILEYITKVELSGMQAPYLPKTYGLWRTELYKNYSGSLSNFIKVVDDTYLPRYLKQLTKVYHTVILNDPAFADLPKDQDSISEIVRVLTEWSIEIELAVDTVERAKLYKMYQVPYGYQDLFIELRNEWSTPEPRSSKAYKFFLRYLTNGAKYAKELMADSFKGYIIQNLVSSRGSIVASIFYAYFCSAFPWPLFALLGTQFACIMSTMIITRVGEQLTTKLDKVQLDYKTKEIKNELEGMISDLMQRNEVSRMLIEKCVNYSEDNLLRLGEHFNQVLSHQTNYVPDQRNFDEDVFIADNAKIKEDEDGWTLIEPPVLEIESLDDWMILE
jgi:hypothetical protein